MRKRVVILSAFLTPFRSGAEACAEEVASELHGKFDITIVTARLQRELPKRGHLVSGVPVIRVGFGIGWDKWLFPFLAPFVVRRLKAPVVHAILESYAGAALIICRFVCPKTKRILTLQSTNTSFLLHYIHDAAQTLTAISSVLVKRAKKYDKAKISLIPNGIPYAAIQKESARTKKVPGRILFVGRLEKVKGVDLLLEAFRNIVHSGGFEKSPLRTCTLHLVGDGHERTHLRNLARAFDIEDRVKFWGYLSGPALLREYAEAEVFCGLSRSEALGNVFLEAQAAGCAVVATKVGGIPDIIEDSETGILVPDENVPAAMHAIERLFKDVKVRKRISLQAEKHAKDYDWHLIAKKYAKVYADALR